MSIFLAALAAATLGAPVTCQNAVALDGDTVKCESGIRLRLTGIDSPELPGHCRKGRICAPGDPIKAKANLVAAMAAGSVTYRPIKVDLYGRTVAMLYAGKVNLNCTQLSSGNAIYVAKWDSGRFVKKGCGL